MARTLPERPDREPRSTRSEQAGRASGATNAIRGVLGVAVPASVSSVHGSHATPPACTDGLTAAPRIGAAVPVAGALIALPVPGRSIQIGHERLVSADAGA